MPWRASFTRLATDRGRQHGVVSQVSGALKASGFNLGRLTAVEHARHV
jgi:hypothetical protein